MHDELKGQVPVGFLVLKRGCERGPDLIVTEVVQMIRRRIGPVAAFKTAMVVAALPKTRSGKILRGYKIPATIDDATSLTGIAEALRREGYAKKQSISEVS